ncbi:hypothetical protein F5B20DRAFT_419090 [Whalleya microplaca]|nr:hypothetical protein F5B20DRAFT_419090 [Whalleya microplaca]
MPSYFDARQQNKGLDNNGIAAAPLLHPSEDTAWSNTPLAPADYRLPSNSTPHRVSDQSPYASNRTTTTTPEKAEEDPEAMSSSSGVRTSTSYPHADTDWLPESVNVLSIFRFLTAITGVAAIVYCQDRNANVLVLRHMQALFTLCWFPTIINLVLSVASVRVQVGSRVLLSTETRRRFSHLFLAVLDLGFVIAILVMSLLALKLEYRGRRGRIVLVAYTVKRWTFVLMWLFNCFHWIVVLLGLLQAFRARALLISIRRLKDRYGYLLLR